MAQRRDTSMFQKQQKEIFEWSKIKRKFYDSEWNIYYPKCLDYQGIL